MAKSIDNKEEADLDPEFHISETDLEVASSKDHDSPSLRPLVFITGILFIAVIASLAPVFHVCEDWVYATWENWTADGSDDAMDSEQRRRYEEAERFVRER